MDNRSDHRSRASVRIKSWRSSATWHGQSIGSRIKASVRAKSQLRQQPVMGQSIGSPIAHPIAPSLSGVSDLSGAIDRISDREHPFAPSLSGPQ
jgi:hypothetical protein